ncbi:Protein of unknown function [Gryllus bimaculatus]|nr:Protein of unknown function [Gryllus bimaculatus]
MQVQGAVGAWLLRVLAALGALRAAAASPAISEARPNGANRPGRFLSLPVPQKCSQHTDAYYFQMSLYSYVRVRVRWGSEVCSWTSRRISVHSTSINVLACPTRRDSGIELSSHTTRPKEFNFRGHNYFFSGHQAQYRNSRLDWLDARNICREYCMDLISMESQEENNLIFRLIQNGGFLAYTLVLIFSRRAAPVVAS